MPMLRMGSRGSAVGELQRALSRAGFDPGPIDNIFGRLTRSAVIAFQRARGLVVDGIVGPQTWDSLDASGGGNSGRGASREERGGDIPVSTAAEWTLPPDLQRIAETQMVRYDRPPPWRGTSGCSDTFTPGAQALKSSIERTFDGVENIWGYACRQNSANTAETSVHGTGRALDIMIDPIGGRANSAAGDPIANWLLENAADIGVQYIIWNRKRWSGDRKSNKFARYTATNQHVDHIHVELNEDGAAMRTPWFRR